MHASLEHCVNANVLCSLSVKILCYVFVPQFYHSFQKTVRQKNTHLNSNQVKYSVQLRNKIYVQLLIIAPFETFQATEISASKLARLFTCFMTQNENFFGK